jgi:hypothetical protein
VPLSKICGSTGSCTNFSQHLHAHLFSNRRRNRVKILGWDRNAPLQRAASVVSLGARMNDADGCSFDPPDMRY